MARMKLRDWALVGLVCLTLVAAGCGRNRDEEGSAGGAGLASSTAVPTMPAARFAMPTSMIDSAKNSTTTVAAGEAVTATVAAGTPEAPAVDLTRGQTIYTNRKCAECHGEQGEGVADKGKAVAGTALSLEEFTDVMRTGRDIGPDHIYGPNAISPGGMEALHAWLQSLPAQ